MAEETAELTFDQQLEALRPKEVVPDAKAEAPTDVLITPALELGEKPAEAKPAEETLEQKLEKITAETEPKPAEEPKLSPEQQQILQAVPNVQTAQQLTQVAANYQNFTGAFERGDFEGVESMIEGWNKNASDGLKEHFYQKYVASGEWVDRWIADKENPGSKAVTHEIKTLRQQLDELKSTHAQRTQQETTQREQQENAAVSQRYQAHLTGLFDQIEFSAADRRWVMADINAKVAGNTAVRTAIQNGNTAAVNAIFKSAVKEYVTRDQQQAEKRETTIAMQDKHKPLVAGSAMVPTTGITDEQIQSAPKPQREALRERKMDDELAALARKHKR